MSSRPCPGRAAAFAAGLGVVLGLALTPAAALAATPAAAKAHKPAAAGKAKRTTKKAPPKAPEPPPLPPLAEASPEQLAAAERVYYGHYECEFNQSIDIHSSPVHLAYVDVAHGKRAWLMKPVLSSTGAIRLEDVRGATLMVQIANKSMLLDVEAGRRLVDDCVSPKQRELIEAARVAKAAAAAEAASAAASPASGAASAAPMTEPPTSLGIAPRS